MKDFNQKEDGRKKYKVLFIILCLLFSVFQTIGICIYKYNGLNVKYYLHGWMEVIAVFTLSMLISCVVLYLFFKYMLIFEYSKDNFFHKIIMKLMKKPVRNSFLVISFFWLPWIVAFYPGSLFYDMTHQLAQYYGTYTIQTHPPFSTMIMGWCMDIGKCIFNSDNIGLFIYVILQYIVCAYACSKVMSLLKDINIPYYLWGIILAFYALFPLYGSTVQCAMKDTLNYGLTLLVAVWYIRLFIEINENKLKKSSIAFYILYCFISCLYRKEMVYVYIVITIVINLFMLYKQRNKKFFVTLVIMVFSIYLSNIFTNDLISKKYFNQEFVQGEAESLSIPLQQIARYVTYYGDEIKDDEKNIIGECFSYGYDGIHLNYNPNISDPIKYNFDVKKSKANGFWKVYMALFKRNPFVYVESILASGYGYFSVVPNVPTTINDAPTNGLPGGRIASTYMNLDPVKESKDFYVEYKQDTEKFRIGLTNFVYAFQIPYNLLYSFGFYSWITLSMLLIAILKKGKQYIIPYILSALLVLVCVASPVNDYGRYYMSVIYIFPLLIGYTKSIMISQNKEDER